MNINVSFTCSFLYTNRFEEKNLSAQDRPEMKFRHMENIHRAGEMAEENQSATATKLHKWLDGERELTYCPNTEWKPFKLLAESYVNPSSLTRLTQKVISCCHRNLIKETETQTSSNALWPSPKREPQGERSWESVEHIGAKQSDFILEFVTSVLTTLPQCFITTMSLFNLDVSISCQVLLSYETKKKGCFLTQELQIYAG